MHENALPANDDAPVGLRVNYVHTNTLQRRRNHRVSSCYDYFYRSIVTHARAMNRGTRKGEREEKIRKNLANHVRVRLNDKEPVKREK